jgi:sortase (surface protein transpeptidase)
MPHTACCGSGAAGSHLASDGPGGRRRGQPADRGVHDVELVLDRTQPIPQVAERPERWRSAVRTAGELLLTAGLVVLLFVVYEVYVTDLLNRGEQNHLSQQLHSQWSHAPVPRVGHPVPYPAGDALAVIHIPRLGADYHRVMLEGTAEKELSQGPGHYVGTAMPGEQGNLAIAGHRVGKGSPFLDLDKLRPGDPIVVETRDSWFVYRVLGDRTTGAFTGDPSGIPGQEIVTPSAIDVISPTPDADSEAPASGAYLTLTTCHPKFSAHKRLIIHARLDGTAYPKAGLPDGPPALAEYH